MLFSHQLPLAYSFIDPPNFDRFSVTSVDGLSLIVTFHVHATDVKRYKEQHGELDPQCRPTALATREAEIRRLAV